MFRSFAVFVAVGFTFLIAAENANAFYHAQLGRFTTRDPLGYIDGPNHYQYGLSSPIVRNDPLGLETQTKTFKAEISNTELRNRLGNSQVVFGWTIHKGGVTNADGAAVWEGDMIWNCDDGKHSWNGVPGATGLTGGDLELGGRDGYSVDEPLKGLFEIIWEPTTSKLESQPCRCGEEFDRAEGTRVIFHWRLVGKLRVKTAQEHIIVLYDSKDARGVGALQEECPCEPLEKSDAEGGDKEGGGTGG